VNFLFSATESKELPRSDTTTDVVYQSTPYLLPLLPEIYRQAIGSDTTTDATALLGARPLSQDLLSPRPEELKGSSDSLSGIFLTHGFSSSRPSLLYFRRIETRDFAIPTVEHYTLGFPRPKALVYVDFLFLLSRLRLYRDFATRNTKLSVVQLPICEASKRRYDPITLSLLATSCPRDLEYPVLGLSLCELPSSRDLSISDTCLPLTPAVPHTTLWLSGYRVSQYCDSRCQIFDSYLTRSR
jgi:hypothetical protein